MNEQTYQEVSQVIMQNLIGLYKLGVRNLNNIDLKECHGDYHDYFFYRKNKYPERYERLMFDTNGHKPYSKDLGSIMSDFVVCGFVEPGKNIYSKNVDSIKTYLKWKKERTKKQTQ